MQPRRRFPRQSRRQMLRLAALGLGGLAVACGRGGPEPASKAEILGEPREPPHAPAAVEPRDHPPPTPVVRGEPVCLVTKQQGVPAAYTPPDLTALPKALSARDGVRLRKAAAEDLVRLLEAARAEDQVLFALDGFRSYEEQDRVFKQEIQLLGREVAERQVAQPGHSEHQLGLAADVTSRRAPFELRVEFGQEPEGRWLAANVTRFGFVISYPQGKEAVTGYTYEPWHIRHVGVPLAEQVAASGLTLIEYLPKHNLAGPCP